MMSSRSPKFGKVGTASKLFAGLMPDLEGDVELAPLHDPTGRKPRGVKLKRSTKLERKDDNKIYRKPSAFQSDVSKDVMKKPGAAPTKARFHHVHMNPCPHPYT
jgi:hypothetical protein